MATRPAKARPAVPLYQLSLTLKWSRPPIWRRVIVRADMKLDHLHDVIQIAMGWTNSHLHQFFAGAGFARTYFGTLNLEFADTIPGMLDETRYSVAELLPLPRRKIIYEYDFGDGWQHDVQVEKILPADPAFRHPVCLAGARACPPEDCGGLSGYYHLLKTIAAPKHPEHDDMKEWIGGELDAERFDLGWVNAQLKRLKA